MDSAFVLNRKWYKMENVKNEGNSLVCCLVNFIDFFCPFTTETSFVSAATKTIKYKHTSTLCIHIVWQRKERLNGKLENIVEEKFFLLLCFWFVLGELCMLKWTLKSALNRRYDFCNGYISQQICTTQFIHLLHIHEKRNLHSLSFYPFVLRSIFMHPRCTGLEHSRHSIEFVMILQWKILWVY